MDNLECEVCGAVASAAKQYAGKALGGLVGGALGLSSRSLLGMVLTAAAGAAVGHLIDEAAAPVCGHCGGRLVPA